MVVALSGVVGDSLDCLWRVRADANGDHGDDSADSADSADDDDDDATVTMSVDVTIQVAQLIFMGQNAVEEMQKKIEDAHNQA